MRNRKRWLALLMATAMVITSLTPAAAAADVGIAVENAADSEVSEAVSVGSEEQAGEAEIAGDLLASFDFNDEAVDGAFVSGDVQAKVQGSCKLQDRDEANGKALYLNGSGAYLDVKKADGSSLLTGMDEVTFSFDAKPDKTETGWYFYAAPNAQAQSSPEYYIGGFVNGGKLKVERYLNGRTQALSDIPVGNDWVHIDVVYAADKTAAYVNGELAKTEEKLVSLPDILKGNSILQIGKANWGGGEYFKGWLDNFSIYGKALSSEELVNTALESVTLASPVTESFELPAAASNGVALSWKMETNSCITLEGNTAKVVRPEGNDVTVKFTVTASAGDVTKSKEIPVTVTAELSGNKVLETAKENLTIVDADSIKGNITLPTELKVKDSDKVVAVTWKSSNTAVITDAAQGKKAAGVVTRPAVGKAAAKVTLTATLTLDGEKVTKEIPVTVQPMADIDTDYSAGYLWTNFGTNGGYEKIFLGYSEDGLKWVHLNKNASGTAQPILANDAEGSDLGVRDPHLIRSAEGDRYWILGTDLHAEGGGAGGSGWNQLSASQNLVVWESTDLVNWSEPRLVYAGFDHAGCVWAPEAIYDEETGDYLVYWSARDNSLAGTNQNALRVYVCRTRDFYSFTEPKVWLSEDQDSGNEVNIIDSTIVNDGKNFYRFSTSDWNTVVDKSATLDSEDVLDVRVNATKSTPNGSWERIVTRSGSSAAGFDGREGFTVYQLPDGRWCAMGDNSGYKAFVTDDLASGKFTTETCSFDSKFRHGTVVRLSKEEEARVMEAYGKTEDPKPTSTPGQGAEKPVLEYNFEKDLDKKVMTDTGAGDEVKDDGVLYGNAKVVYDEARKSNVLELDGSNGTYGEFPKGFFDGRNTMSISMDVKSQMSSGNFFTFTYGQDNTYYDFLRVRGTDVRNAITVTSWQNESDVSGTGALTGQWQKIVLVIDGTNMKLYLDGDLVDENTSTGIQTSDLGSDLLAYLGKSFYSDDGYFKGSFDNIQVYNRVLTSDEILEEVIDSAQLVKAAVVGTAPDRETALTYRGTDDHNAAYTAFDKEKKVIQPYVRKSADVKKLPVKFSVLTKDVKITVDGKDFVNGGEMDLSKEVEVTFSIRDRQETYTIKPAILCNNSVLPGQYADPDIDYFDGKYWIFPTTDGYPGWSGTKFHAWSSPDMVNWEDEGIIMELANDNPGTNEKGVQIATSGWAVRGSAWAPTIEKKNGKYYFYYCGKDSSGTSSIGVAVADNPAGPYTDKGELLVSQKMCNAAGVSMGQAIDPSIFTEEDGTSYILFGNGAAAIAELNEDMMSIKEGSIRQITGLSEFRESVVVMKVNGKYHWTWSCDDANSPNYHVNYGVTDSLFTADGRCAVTCTKTWLVGKNESLGILGTAHQSMLHIVDESGKDRYFMAYHRFYTPVNIFTSSDGLGVHRETCIDEIFFDENGQMMVTTTLEGVGPVYADSEEARKEARAVLQKTTAAAQALNQKDYTEASWAALVAALDKAKAAADKENAYPKELKDAAALVDAAVNALVKAPAPTNPPKKPHKSHVGKTFYAGNLKYKVTKDDEKGREVRVTSMKGSKKTLKIPATVQNTTWKETFKVTSVKAKAFKGKNITAAVIGKNVTKIGPNAFMNCKKLKSVVIGKNVKNIGVRAFYGCKNLKKITIKSTVLKTVKKNAFKKISKKAVIKVPKSKKSTYTKRLKGKIDKGVKIK